MGPLWPTTCFGIKDSSVYKEIRVNIRDAIGGSLAKGGSLKSISDRFSAPKAPKNFDK